MNYNKKAKQLLKSTSFEEKLKILNSTIELTNFLGSNYKLSLFNGNIKEEFCAQFFLNSFNEDVLYKLGEISSIELLKNGYNAYLTKDISIKRIYDYKDYFSKNEVLTYILKSAFIKGLSSNVLPLVDVKSLYQSIMNKKIDPKALNEIFYRFIKNFLLELNNTNFNIYNLDSLFDDIEIDSLVESLISNIIKYNDKKEIENIDYDNILSNLVSLSSILLKNDDSILPLKINDKILYIAKDNEISKILDEFSLDYKLISFNEIDYNSLNIYDKIAIISDNIDKDIVSKIKEYNENIIVVLKGSYIGEFDYLSDIKGLLFYEKYNFDISKSIIYNLYSFISPSGRLKEDIVKNDLDKDKNNSLIESIFIGYREFEKNKDNIIFRFTEGLTYSNIKYSNLSLRHDKRNVYVKVNVLNDSIYDSYIPTLLFLDVEVSNTYRANPLLLKFKSIYLKAYEEKTLEFIIPLYNFEIYSFKFNKMVIENAKYKIFIGDSITRLNLSKSFNLKSKDNLEDNLKELIPEYFNFEYNNDSFEKIFSEDLYKEKAITSDAQSGKESEENKNEVSTN